MIILLSSGIQTHCARWRFPYLALEFISSTRNRSTVPRRMPLIWARLGGLPCRRKVCSPSCAWVGFWKSILSFQARCLAIGLQFFEIQSMALHIFSLLFSLLNGLPLLRAPFPQLMKSWCLWLILTPYIVYVRRKRRIYLERYIILWLRNHCSLSQTSTDIVDRFKLPKSWSLDLTVSQTTRPRQSISTFNKEKCYKYLLTKSSCDQGRQSSNWFRLISMSSDTRDSHLLSNLRSYIWSATLTTVKLSCRLLKSTWSPQITLNIF